MTERRAACVCVCVGGGGGGGGAAISVFAPPVTDTPPRHCKHCDMHMHSIPFIKLLLCMFVQATDLMYLLIVYSCTYPLYKYSF